MESGRKLVNLFETFHIKRAGIFGGKLMRRVSISQLREKIRAGQYDMTAHAMEEMAEDNLDIIDVENAVLNGRIKYIQRDDSRGKKYVVEGVACDLFTPVGIAGRFTGTARFLIITVYEIS